MVEEFLLFVLPIISLIAFSQISLIEGTQPKDRHPSFTGIRNRKSAQYNTKGTDISSNSVFFISPLISDLPDRIFSIRFTELRTMQNNLKH